MTTPPNIGSDAENNNEETTPTKTDIIGNLPTELVEKIISYLSPEDLRSAVSCSLRWKDAMSYKHFWNKLCLREGYLEVEESQRSEFYANFLERYNYWQGVYWYYYTLRKNWISNSCKKRLYAIKEPACFLSYSFFDDIFVVKCTDKMKLTVCHLKATELKQSAFPLRQDVLSGGGKLLKSGKYLSHFVTKSSLIVWDYENETKVLDVVWDHVTDVYVFENLFALKVQSEDTFQIFNIETRQIEYESKGIFPTLVIMEGWVVFLTQRNFIHMLKWSDKSLVTIEDFLQQGFRHPKYLVKSDLLLRFWHNEINTGTRLTVWNITTKTILYTIPLGSLYFVDACFLNNYLYVNYFHSAGIGRFVHTFELMDYKDGTVIVRVTDLETSGLSNEQLMVVGRSQKLSLWCLKTRDFICNLDFSLTRRYLNSIDMVVTKTKLAYATKVDYDSVLLYVRDYEILDC